MIDLPSSVPTISQYEKLLSSELFHDMEEYSNVFLQANQKFLEEYAARWVKDPFHQWSRQWEYTFVYSKIMDHYSKRSPAKVILDAGSGITFFPYFLKSKLDPINIICCDIDPQLKGPYNNINKNQGQYIQFKNLNLENLTNEDESIDIVYCISVIEHTNSFQKIVDEFYRVLKPGGKLIVTFDISLDGTADLSPEKSETLLQYLHSKFSCSEIRMDIKTLLAKPDIVTMNYVYNLNPNLIPMRRHSFFKSFLKSIFMMKPSRKVPYPLTFFCLDFQKV